MFIVQTALRISLSRRKIFKETEKYCYYKLDNNEWIIADNEFDRLEESGYRVFILSKDYSDLSKNILSIRIVIENLFSKVKQFRVL